MLVADGLGGLPLTPDGKTELETARTPNLDQLAHRGVQGASMPVLPGITPGSGPGHLGLFGYDPLKFVIGRGALEATGVGFRTAAGRCGHALQLLHDRPGGQDHRSARGTHFFGRERSAGHLAAQDLHSRDVQLFVEPVKEHRFVVVFRGEGLEGAVADTDPQVTGVPPLDPVAQ